MGIRDIIEFWKSSNIKLNDGVKLTEITSLEKHIDFQFPDTFKQFYSEINGFKDSAWNEHMFSIFPIERIKEEFDFLKNKDFYENNYTMVLICPIYGCDNYPFCCAAISAS